MLAERVQVDGDGLVHVPAVATTPVPPETEPGPHRDRPLPRARWDGAERIGRLNAHDEDYLGPALDR